MPTSNRSNKIRPSVKLQNGIIPKEESTEMAVIVADKLMFASKSRQYRLLYDPPGTIPEKNNPSAKSGRSEKSAKLRPNAVSGMKINWLTNPIAGPTGLLRMPRMVDMLSMAPNVILKMAKTTINE